MSHETSNYINLTAYPVDQPDTPLYRSLVAEQKKLLETAGMINLTGFLTPEGVTKYRAEVEGRLDIAFHTIKERHPYGYYRSDDFPADHPRNTFGRTESYRLARHHFPNTAIDALYCWPPMRQFIADITGHDQTYLSADPSNGLVAQVYKEGCGIAWHFDQTLFSTIINLSEPEEGGVFECVPGLRAEDDPGYSEVKRVLDGKSGRVQKHIVTAGSFIIMIGRYTMHRVTNIEKKQPRISVILSYELEPGKYMDLDTRKISFGSTAPDQPLVNHD